MKALLSTKLLVAILFGVLTISFNGFAQDKQKSKEVTIKTSANQEASINKMETITGLLKGVSKSSYNTKDKVLTVKYDPETINTDMLSVVMDMLGFDCKVLEDKFVEEINPELKDLPAKETTKNASN